MGLLRFEDLEVFKRAYAVSLDIGSADEMRVWLRYCVDLGYIEQDDWQRWRDEYEHIAKMLQGLSARTRARSV